MRVTLSIDDDVLAAAKAIAKTERRSVGYVISSLARKALRSVPAAGAMRNGIPLLTPYPDASRIDSQLVKRLSEELA